MQPIPNQTIPIPVSTVEKLAALGRAMLSLAEDMKKYTQASDSPKPPISLPGLVVPKQIPLEDEWFWSDAWQTGEKAVNKAFQEGKYEVFENVDDLIADLRRLV